VEPIGTLNIAWNALFRVEQAKRGTPDTPTPVTEVGADVVLNPSRRTRTPLTDKEVEAIRTLRDEGESVLSIAKRFNVHRATVWEHTKTSPAQ
jgi:DNA invertase Pin-like site-specific DNA recombinase